MAFETRQQIVKRLREERNRKERRPDKFAGNLEIGGERWNDCV